MKTNPLIPLPTIENKHKGKKHHMAASFRNMIGSGTAPEAIDKFQGKQIPQELFNIFGGKKK